MTFRQAVSTCLAKYATVEGRAARSEFWWFFAFQIICYFATLAAVGMLRLPVGLANVVLVLLLVPNIAVTVRRLHDIDRTGWWYLLYFVPLGGLVMLIFLLTPGTAGGNRFDLPRGDGREREDVPEESYSKSPIPRVRRRDEDG